MTPRIAFLVFCLLIFPGDPEVNELYATFWRKEYISGFDVAMSDPLRVQILHTAKDLIENGPGKDHKPLCIIVFINGRSTERERGKSRRS